MDYFLLKTSATLGDITSITLSHGSEGPQPHWFVRSSLVYDVQTGKKYIFICNSWLSNTKTTRPEDPPSTTKTFAVADAVKTHIGGLLLLNSTHDLKQRHLWLSLFKCSDQSHFSLSQRLVCLLCLFMMSMLINVMFFGVDDLPTNKVIKAGTLTYSTTKLMISIQSALMMIPSTLLLVKFFTSCRPRYPFHVIREEVSLYEEDGSHHPASLHPSKMFHHRVNSRPVTPHGKRSILSTGISLASVFSASRLGYWYKHSLESNRVRAAPEAREQDHSMNKNSTLDRSQQRLPSSQHNIQNTGPIVAEETTVSSNTMPAPAIAKPKEPQPIQTINIKIPQPKSHGQDLLTVDIPGMNEVFSRPGTRMTVSVYPLDELAYKQTTDNLLETEIVGGRAVRRSGPPLPWWCLIFAWLLVVLVTGTCAFHIVLYTFNYGYEKSYNWAMSVLVSKVLDIFLFDPLRIAGVCCLFTIYYKKFYIESLPLDIDVGAKEKDRGALGKIKEVMLS